MCQVTLTGCFVRKDSSSFGSGSTGPGGCSIVPLAIRFGLTWYQVGNSSSPSAEAIRGTRAQRLVILVPVVDLAVAVLRVLVEAEVVPVHVRAAPLQLGGHPVVALDHVQAALVGDEQRVLAAPVVLARLGEIRLVTPGRVGVRLIPVDMLPGHVRLGGVDRLAQADL